MLWWRLRQTLSGDRRTRRRAAEKLGGLRNPRAVEGLLLLLRDEEDVRDAAEKALVRTGAMAVPFLFGVMRGSSADVRDRAAGVLAEIGSPAVEYVADRLDTDGSSAIDVLRRIGPAGEGALLDALQHSVESTRCAAAEVLGSLVRKTSSAAAVNGLRGALQDPAGEVRLAAAFALAAVGDRSAMETLVVALGWADAETRYRATRTLEELDPGWTGSEEAKAAAPSLISAASGIDSSRWDVIRDAAEFLDRIDPEWTRSAPARDLAPHLVRSKMVDPLERMLRAHPVDLSLRLITHEDADIAFAAARALASFSDVRVLAPLISFLEARKIGPRDAFQPLKHVLDLFLPDVSVEDLKRIVRLGDQVADGSPVRELARQELDHRAAAASAVALGDPDVERRLTAIGSLARVRGSLEVLFILLQDREPRVRMAAARALTKIKPDWICDLIETGASANSLIESMQYVSVEAQCLAAASLGRGGDQRALPVLLHLLRGQPPKVRREAVAAMAQLKDTRAVDPLCGLLLDSDVEIRRGVVACLAAAGTASAAQALVRALEDADDAVRRSTAEALEKCGDPSLTEPLVEVAARGRTPRLVCSLLDKIAPDWRGSRQAHHVASTIIAAPEEVPRSAYLLGELLDPRAVTPLLAAITPDLPGQWAELTAALRKVEPGWAGRDEAREPLAMLMSNIDHSHRGRWTMAVRALMNAGPGAWVDRMINHPRQEVRREAVEVLGQLQEPFAAAALIAALDAEVVQATAAMRRGEFGWAPEALPLAHVLQHSNCSQIVQFLYKYGDARVVLPVVRYACSCVHWGNPIEQTDLERLVNTNLPHLSPDELRGLTGIGNTREFMYKKTHDYGEGEGRDEVIVVAVDCSSIAQLSRQELSRRGLEA